MRTSVERSRPRLRGSPFRRRWKFLCAFAVRPRHTVSWADCFLFLLLHRSSFLLCWFRCGFSLFRRSFLGRLLCWCRFSGRLLCCCGNFAFCFHFFAFGCFLFRSSFFPSFRWCCYRCWRNRRCGSRRPSGNG